MNRILMRVSLTVAMLAAGMALAAQAAAQVMLYEREEFRGPSFRVDDTEPRQLSVTAPDGLQQSHFVGAACRLASAATGRGAAASTGL
jgi:hypothetical protein